MPYLKILKTLKCAHTVFLLCGVEGPVIRGSSIIYDVIIGLTVIRVQRY